MKKILFVAISALSTSAFAWEPDFYAGANYSSWQLEATNGTGNLTAQALEGSAGINLHKYLALEARVGGGISTDRSTIVVSPAVAATTDNNGDPVAAIPAVTFQADLELKYYASAYLKPQLSNDVATLYGLLGYTSTELESTNLGLAPDDSFNGLSIGMGVSFVYSETVDVTFEWKKLINADDFDMRGGSIGFKYSF